MDLDEIIDKHISEMAGAKLNRVGQMLQSKDVAFISAYMEGLSVEENKRRDQILKKLIRELNFGYVELEGCWKNPDTNTVTKEQSIMTSYCIKQNNISSEDFEKAILYLGAAFKQQAVIFKRENKEGYIYYYNKKDKKEKLGVWHPNKIAQMYSKIKNKPFSFEENIKETFEGDVPTGLYGAMYLSQRTKRYMNKIENSITNGIENIIFD